MAPEGASSARRQIAHGVTQSLGAIRLARLLGCADGGNPDVDLAGDPGESQRVGALVAQALECEVTPSISPNHPSTVARFLCSSKSDSNSSRRGSIFGLTCNCAHRRQASLN
jgi:hypothetical protein